jgi:DtxR family Mn-dependent transcriptional regulator
MSHYLGELHRLGGESALVSPSRLAEVMGVSVPAAARMIERLEEPGLTERVPHRGVRLTDAGTRLALREIRYHRLSEAFLVRVMGYGWHEAHEMADALAEVADETFVARMDETAGHPTRCPHGEPIPTADGTMPEVHDTPLTELPIGFSGTVSRVRARDDERLIYLAKVGLVPGQAIEIANRGPFGGPLRIRVGRQEEVLGADLAELIRAAAD